eukprot:1956427-Amphidinium_carterae.1
MQYRDLVPGRIGGALIASSIHIPAGGAVPDYCRQLGVQTPNCLQFVISLLYYISPSLRHTSPLNRCQGGGKGTERLQEQAFPRATEQLSMNDDDSYS